jgi:hypothetical protein
MLFAVAVIALASKRFSNGSVACQQISLNRLTKVYDVLIAVHVISTHVTHTTVALHAN